MSFSSPTNPVVVISYENYPQHIQGIWNFNYIIRFSVDGFIGCICALYIFFLWKTLLSYNSLKYVKINCSRNVYTCDILTSRRYPVTAYTVKNLQGTIVTPPFWWKTNRELTILRSVLIGQNRILEKRWNDYGHFATDF